MEQRRTLTWGGTDMRKLAVLVRMAFTRILGPFAVWMWHSPVGGAVYRDAVDGQVRNRYATVEKAGHGGGALTVHIRVVVGVLFAGVQALSERGKAAVAVEVGAQAGGLAVKGRQVGVDAAGQFGVGGLSGK